MLAVINFVHRYVASRVPEPHAVVAADPLQPLANRIVVELCVRVRHIDLLTHVDHLQLLRARNRQDVRKHMVVVLGQVDRLDDVAVLKLEPL